MYQILTLICYFSVITGMDTLNNAIENLYNRVPPEKWLFASVAVAPSTITISEHSVRYFNVLNSHH